MIKIKKWTETDRYIDHADARRLVIEFCRPWNGGRHWREVKIHNNAVREKFGTDAYKVHPCELEQFVTDYCRRALNA